MKRKIYASLVLLIVLLNIISWNSTAFCDWFRYHVFKIQGGCFARFSNSFPFSLGEYMIAAGVLLLIAAVLSLLCLAVCRALKRKKRQPAGFVRRYLKTFAWILLAVSFVMTVNCFVLYHCSSFQKLYLGKEEKNRYSLRQLVEVRDYVISNANRLSGKMKRDEDGNLIYDGDMGSQAGRSMRKLSQMYPELKGYYPRPKQIQASKFLSQQYMMGYYFPFSMEANYNREMYLSNVPFTMCHELSHLQGFIYEQDANFIGYLACVSSDDPFFQYSGYLSMINYLDSDLLKSLDGDRTRYMTYRQCNRMVRHDNIFLTKDAWKEVEKSAVIKTATLKKASNAFLTTNLNMNGVEDGLASYGDVVHVLLEYYRGKLYQ